SVLSVIRLNKVFDISEEENTAKKNKLFVVVIGLAEEKFALIVDELLGQQEIVIKSLNHKIVNTPGIAGATILGDGKVVLIIDVATIIANSRKKVI
ncbi:MAG TPA: chemotaxis protein CheW, partial [bacterium]|nr:chemotaxis protein CheW [bacterium]